MDSSTDSIPSADVREMVPRHRVAARGRRGHGDLLRVPSGLRALRIPAPRRHADDRERAVLGDRPRQLRQDRKSVV